MNHRINKAIEHYQLIEAEQLSNSLFTDNYVAKAHSTKLGRNVVLKVFNTHNTEIETLKHFDGQNCVKLIDYNQDLNACIIEYIEPGTRLSTKFPDNDNEAIETVANLIQKLIAKPINPNDLAKFKTVYNFMEQILDFDSKKIPAEIWQKGKKVTQKLYEQEVNLKLLHGDLHHYNILLKDTEWIAIDPKGVFGPIEFEITRFMINPIPTLVEASNTKAIIESRINKFCQIFELEKQSLVDWLHFQLILSAYWAEMDDDQKLLNYSVEYLAILQNIIYQQ